MARAPAEDSPGSRTSWRGGQSRANPSLHSDSLIRGKVHGNRLDPGSRDKRPSASRQVGISHHRYPTYRVMPLLPLDHPEPLAATLGVMLGASAYLTKPIDRGDPFEDS